DTGRHHAISTALGSKSYWHLSRTLAAQTGMTNEWLESQGLINIREQWMKAHGYVLTNCVLPRQEPPGADALAGWCGDRGFDAPGYPIACSVQSARNEPVQAHSGFRSLN